MGEIEGKILRRGCLFFSVVLLMVGLSMSNSYGEEARSVSYGFSVFGGTGDALHNEPDLKVYGFLPRIDLPLHRNWDLEVEGNYSYWSLRKEHDLYFLGLDLNILFKPIHEKWGSLFLLAGGGLGYDSAGERVKQIGDQHLGGILQGGTGFYFSLGEGVALRAEYRFYHISEPFRSDEGLNSHNVLLGISF